MGAGLISKVLLANADALCAAASPLMDQDIESVWVVDNIFPASAPTL